jgi:hypothetical protein
VAAHVFSATKEGAGMTEQITCDACKQPVEVVSDDALCFACETFHSFTTAIKEDTDLSNEDVLDLGELSGMVLSAILVRLQSDGRSLLKDLLQTMERREKPN